MSAAVFCDFDGTISAHETFVATLKREAPELSAELIPKMLGFELTLREGVRRILESIPSDRLDAFAEVGRTAALRPGFEALLDTLAARGIPFVVVSGGVRVMVEAALAPYRDRIHSIHGVDLDVSGARFRVISPLEGGTELVEKRRVLEAVAGSPRVTIGDSLTDLEMSQHADVVFARDKLAGWLAERDVAYHPWGDFHDVRRQLEALWGWN